MPRSLEAESARLIAAYDGNRIAVFDAIETQFRTLQNRAQVILGICGALLTVSVLLMTGKLILASRGDTQLYVASRLLILAGGLDVVSGAVAVLGVLHIRWVTPPSGPLQPWVMNRLVHRDQKTRALHVSMALLVLSLLAYQAVAAIVLVQM